MKLAQPEWLWVGLAASLFLLWRLRRHDRRRHESLGRFLAPHLVTELTNSVCPRRRTVKRILYLTGVGLLFVALARPQVGSRWEIAHRKGLDILFAVDTSKSMLAQDVKPNRLGRARLAVEDLLRQLDGDGVGLIAFSGKAFLQCPLTLDYDAFGDSLDALDTTIIPRGGTDIAAAIREAEKAFADHGDSDRILIVLSDGEDLNGDSVSAAQEAKRDGLTIFTVGVGTTNGELIPVETPQGGTAFLKGPNGAFVKSRLEEDTLRQIAEVTGGLYEPLGQQGEGLLSIYQDGLAAFQRHDLATRRHRVALERFEWPLALAMLCLAGDWMIGTRRRPVRHTVEPGSASPSPAWPSSRSAAAAVLLLAILPPAGARASSQSAETAYLQGDFTKARSEYGATAARKPGEPRLQFNLGAASYMTHDYTGAERAFTASLQSGTVPIQQNAYYSLGNTHYRIGQETEQNAPQKTIEAWQQAVKSYDAALEIDPRDEDARFNRDLVKRKLEQLQKRQAEQERQNRNQNQGQGQQDRQNQKSQQANADQGKENRPSQAQPQSSQPERGGDKPQPAQTARRKASERGATRPEEESPTWKSRSPVQNATQNLSEQPSEPEEQTMADRRQQPGEMSREEARHLLNSLRSEERHLAPVAAFDGRRDGQEQQPLKDW